MQIKTKGIDPESSLSTRMGADNFMFQTLMILALPYTTLS